MGQGLTAKCKPECSENNEPCCTQFGRGSWPSRDAFYENYDMGSILKNSPYGYTCFVTPRKGDPKRVCELTIRDLKTTLYESTIDTRSMYEENLLALQHNGIARCS